MEKLLYRKEVPVKGHLSLLIRSDKNEEYLRKIVSEAFDAESRQEEPVYWNQWEMEDGSHWVSLDGNFCRLARVLRRVEFRLRNNKWIEKKTVHLWDEIYFIPNQFCAEHRYWWHE